MTDVLIIKGLFLSVMWTLCWLACFAHTSADVSLKNISIALAPWIVLTVYFLFFWWG